MLAHLLSIASGLKSQPQDFPEEVVLWLRLLASIAGCEGLTSGQETTIPHAV